MKRSRFSEEQLIAVLKEQESGVATANVCRRHGISSAPPRARVYPFWPDMSLSLHQRARARGLRVRSPRHSHSIVPGGFEVMS